MTWERRARPRHRSPRRGRPDGRTGATRCPATCSRSTRPTPRRSPPTRSGCGPTRCGGTARSCSSRTRPRLTAGRARLAVRRRHRPRRARPAGRAVGAGPGSYGVRLRVGGDVGSARSDRRSIVRSGQPQTAGSLRACRAREIALLTNPTAGKGKGGQGPRPGARAAARRRAGRAQPPGPRRRRGARPGPAVRGRRRRRPGRVRRRRHGPPRASRRWPTTGTPLGIIPAGTGNDVARYFDLPRKDPVAAADRVIAGAHPHHRPRPERVAVLRHRAGRRLRRRRQRARQPDDLAEGPDALQPRHPRRAAGLRAAALHARSSTTGRLALDAMLVAVGNGPSFGGGLRITEGAVLDDGLLDVVIIKPMTKPGLIRTYPKLFKGTHVHHPQYEHHLVRSVTVAAPGHRVVRRRRALRPAAPDRRVRPRRADGSAHEHRRAPGLRRVRRAVRLRARRLPASRLPRGRGGHGASWSRPPPAPARRWSASSPSTWRSRPAASASTRRRSRRCRTRSTTTSSPATAPTGSACSPATRRSTARRRSW